jgi:hypothetical protein
MYRKEIEKNIQEKILFSVKTTKNNFSDPQTTSPNKTYWKHFDRRYPKKPPLN